MTTETPADLAERLRRGQVWLAHRWAELVKAGDFHTGTKRGDEFNRQLTRWREMEMDRLGRMESPRRLLDCFHAQGVCPPGVVCCIACATSGKWRDA